MIKVQEIFQVRCSMSEASNDVTISFLICLFLSPELNHVRSNLDLNRTSGSSSHPFMLRPLSCPSGKPVKVDRSTSAVSSDSGVSSHNYSASATSTPSTTTTTGNPFFADSEFLSLAELFLSYILIRDVRFGL